MSLCAWKLPVELVLSCAEESASRANAKTIEEIGDIPVKVLRQAAVGADEITEVCRVPSEVADSAGIDGDAVADLVALEINPEVSEEREHLGDLVSLEIARVKLLDGRAFDVADEVEKAFVAWAADYQGRELEAVVAIGLVGDRGLEYIADLRAEPKAGAVGEPELFKVGEIPVQHLGAADPDVLAVEVVHWPGVISALPRARGRRGCAAYKKELEGVDRVAQVDGAGVIRISGILAAWASRTGKKIAESGYSVAQIDIAITIRVAPSKPVAKASESSKADCCWQRDQADHQECIFYQESAPRS